MFHKWQHKRQQKKSAFVKLYISPTASFSSSALLKIDEQPSLFPSFFLYFWDSIRFIATYRVHILLCAVKQSLDRLNGQDKCKRTDRDSAKKEK